MAGVLHMGKMKRIQTDCLVLGAALWIVAGSSAAQTPRLPNIIPDYAGVVIPSNIAPLNFVINEPGMRFRVVFTGETGETIRMESKSPAVKLPLKQWRNLLAANAGREIRIEISVCDASGRWTSFSPIRDRVAEPIDSHLVYRLIDPAYNLWKKMGIYQRNIETFEETPVLINRLTEDNCMNCHNFCKNSPIGGSCICGAARARPCC